MDILDGVITATKDIFSGEYPVIITLIVTIFPSLVAYHIYKLSVKYLNKKIIIHNFITLFWRLVVYYTLIFPILLLIFQVSLLASIDKNVVFLYSLVYILVIAVLMIIYYIKIVQDIKNKKLIQSLCMYIFPLLCLAFVPFILIFLTILVVEPNSESPVIWLSAYVFNIICASVIYFSFVNTKDVTRYVKEVRIFYSENGKMKVNFKIRYEDFDIDKHYVKFYLRQKGYRKVIQTKDLIRIEYYYGD